MRFISFHAKVALPQRLNPPPRTRVRNRCAPPFTSCKRLNDVCYSRGLFPKMYIKKQRLWTPGPTPLYPPALHAMMRADMHHRTEDFRKVYRACLADLKEVMGTSNDVLMFAASGTGAMDGAVSNLFSKGDKVIVGVAGKFGERWAEIAKASGLDANVIT